MSHGANMVGQAPTQRSRSAISRLEATSAARVGGTVLDSYRVPAGGGPDSSAEVIVAEEQATGRYHVLLPPLDQGEAEALALLRDNLLYVVPPDATGTSEEIVKQYLTPTAERTGVAPVVRAAERKLLYHLLREFAGYWELDTFMRDDRIEEISVTRHDRPVRLLHRGFSEYMFMETNVTFSSEARLQGLIRRLAQFGGTTVSLAQPSLEVTLQGVSDTRITATLGDEISRPGSTLAIRKQREHPLTLAHLASPEEPGIRSAKAAPSEDAVPPYEESHVHKTLSVLMAAYFWLLLERTTNVLIAGETNSGKTTLMNAILALINPRTKIVTAEDVLEINLPDHLHWQRLKTRSYRAGLSPSNGTYEYDLSDLLKLSLRFSPTVLSLGEMRGEESETVAAAITLGTSTMTTVHAESAERCVQRLTTTPAEVVDRSYRLAEIARGLGWSPSKLQAKLTMRAAYVARTIGGGNFSPQALSEMVRDFSVTDLSPHREG
ncbi:MAG: type II/IV secretion system ATPase subunit [Thaumarchaeota archaeon]|nr:type II/IV secretion system ATPase subunit [Nitrososphaerota archaeon]